MFLRHWSLHLVNARGQLSPCAAVIARACAEAEARFATVAPPLALDIVASAVAAGNEALYVTGNCYEPGVIGLRIGVTQFRPEAALHQDVLKVMLHELHHALRWEGPGYGATLGEALVSEGLAQRFLHEMMDVPPEPFEHAVPAETCEAWRRAAFLSFDDGAYDHDAWFFGTGRQPNWLGYTLGRHMTDRFLARHPHETALSLAHAEAESFRWTLEEAM